MAGMDNIRRGIVTRRRSKTGSGSTAINGGIITIPLDLTWLVESTRVLVSVAQAFTGAPTSYDVRRFFKKAQFVVSDGDGFKLNFHAAYDLSRLAEMGVAPVVSLGTSATAKFSFAFHHAMNASINGMITCLLSGKYSNLALELTVADDATNGFIGGTTPLVATYGVEVYPSEYRNMTPVHRGDQAQGWGCASHHAAQLSTISGGVAGVDQDVLLKSGNKTRYMIMHAFDAASNGSLTDAVFANGAMVSMEVNGYPIYDNTSLMYVREHMVNKNNFLSAGVIVLDAGSDPHQWWDFRHEKSPKIRVNIPASASLPAAWRLEIAQDYVIGMNDARIPAALRA